MFLGSSKTWVAHFSVQFVMKGYLYNHGFSLNNTQTIQSLSFIIHITEQPKLSNFGGVLRDQEGNFLCIFSCSTFTKKTIVGEVLVIRKFLRVLIVFNGLWSKIHTVTLS